MYTIGNSNSADLTYEINPRERENNGLYIALVLKVGLTTVGTLVNFDWLAH